VGPGRLTGESRAEARLGDDINVVTKEVAKVHQQSTEVEQATVGIEIDQEVDIAGIGRITTGNGPEDPDVRRPTSAGEPKYLGAVRAQIGKHGSGHGQRVPRRTTRVGVTGLEPGTSTVSWRVVTRSNCSYTLWRESGTWGCTA
jgi:hypothetical protein